MKICYITSTLNASTGQGKLALETLLAAKNAGAEVAAMVAEASEYPGEHLLLGRTRLLLANFFKIRRVIKGYDIVHAFDGWPNSVVAAVASLGLNKKLIITGVGSATIKPFTEPLRRFLIAWSYKRADKLVAISRYTAAEINKYMPRLEIEVINPGVNLIEHHECDPGILNKIKALQPYVLSVGTLKERKGYRYSVPAFSAAAQKLPGLNYVIVNNQPRDPTVDSLLEFISTYNRDGKIHILNHIAERELEEFYAHADIFMLLPFNDDYDFEGFGMVFVEAGVHGVPSISTRGNGSQDAVHDARTGVTVNQKNSQMAAVAILKLMNDQHLKNELGKNARKLAASLTWENVNKQYGQIYEKLLQTN